MQHLANNAKRAQKFGQIVHKFDVCVPCNEKEAVMLSHENGNTGWQDVIKTEMDQLFECNILKDFGKNTAVSKGCQLIKPQIVLCQAIPQTEGWSGCMW